MSDRSALALNPDRTVVPQEGSSRALARDKARTRQPFADPVFILSLPRSFSSVVGAMLGQHPEIYGLPETNLFTARTLGEWFAHCSRPGVATMRHGLLRAVAQLYFGGQTEAAVKLAAAWLMRRAHFTTGFLFEILAEKVSPRAPLDKSPHIVGNLQFMQRAYSMFPQAKFIHLVRHPRGQGESMITFYEHRKAYGPLPPWHWLNSLMTEPMSPVERRQGARLDPQRGWYVLNARICDFLAAVPQEQQLRVRGEDLLGDPDAGLLRIAEWLGLRNDAEAIERMKHPEQSPYASFGPPGARYGNDPFFLKDPALRPAQSKPQTLEGPLSWTDDGRGFLPKVRRLAEEFGYE
jgi:sulfotransferase family protein